MLNPENYLSRPENFDLKSFDYGHNVGAISTLISLSVQLNENKSIKSIQHPAVKGDFIDVASLNIILESLIIQIQEQPFKTC